QHGNAEFYKAKPEICVSESPVKSYSCLYGLGENRLISARQCVSRLKHIMGFHFVNNLKILAQTAAKPISPAWKC
ncbi:hypothetical protein ACYTX7_09335, partial [Streptococcus pyogenes]